jgi:PKD repeat protein
MSKPCKFKSLLFCAALILVATGALAQNYPFPASTPSTDVMCSGCPGRETLLTIGYPPVLRFVGRWCDAESARDYQQNFRTARPKLARVAADRNRIYTILGSALAVYDTDRFFSRLNARPQEAMAPATQVPVNGGNPRYPQFGPPEVFLWWDTFFYAENGGGWVTPFQDGQERLWDFDWDDRGNVYLAYSVYGWGIVKDGGEIGGGRMRSVSQTLGPDPDHILSLKTSDGHYYAAISDRTQPSLLQIWDVQDAGAPVKQPDIADRSFYLWAKDSTGSRVGIVEYSGGLSIFTSDAFVRTGTPLIHFEAGGGGTFRMIAGDGTNFYAYGASGSGPFIDVISPSGNTYAEKRYPCNGYGLPTGMHYGDGYLALYGVEIGADASHPTSAGTWNIRVYKAGQGALIEIPFEIPVPGKPASQPLPFWSMYYGANSPRPGYARPQISNIMDVTPVKNGSKVYLIISAYGLGDVWEINPGDSPPQPPAAPDPVIVKIGCLTVGSPCSFTVTSAQNQSLVGWSFAWTVNPSATNSGTAASSFRPQFTTTADYTVGVIATNGIGSKPASLTGHIDKAPACSSAPDDLNAAIGIFTNSAPAIGDAVPFHIFATGWTPSTECDKFEWSFSDGGTSTDMFPMHAFTAAGKYIVRLKLTGALSTGNYATSVTIAGNAGCSGAPDDINNAIGINSNTVPNPGDTVTFIMFPRGWVPSVECDKFAWTFGDGGSSTDMIPSHVYTKPGSYSVSLKVTSALSSATYTTAVTIASRGCGTMTTDNVFILFNGDGCSAFTSGNCSGKTDVAFSVSAVGYDLTCGPPAYSWDFGDGTRSTEAAPSHRYAANGRYIVRVRVTVGAAAIDLTAAHPVTIIDAAPAPPAVNRRRRGN